MEDFYRYYQFIVYLLFQGVKYGIPFEALWYIVRGEGYLTDLCQMLFLPSICTYLMTQRGWIKGCCLFILFLGLFLNAERLLIVLVATGIWFLFVYCGIRAFSIMSARFMKHNE